MLARVSRCAVDMYQRKRQHRRCCQESVIWAAETGSITQLHRRAARPSRADFRERIARDRSWPRPSFAARRAIGANLDTCGGTRPISVIQTRFVSVRFRNDYGRASQSVRQLAAFGNNALMVSIAKPTKGLALPLRRSSRLQPMRSAPVVSTIFPKCVPESISSCAPRASASAKVL